MKKTLLTLGAVALLSSTSLFAAQDNLQEQLRMQEKVEKQQRDQYKYKNSDEMGSGTKNQYQHQYQNQYKGTNPSRPNTGSVGGQRSGGGGRH